MIGGCELCNVRLGERSNKAVVESFISGFHLKVQSFSFEKFNLEAQKGSLGLMQPCTLHSPEDFLEKNSIPCSPKIVVDRVKHPCG